MPNQPRPSRARTITLIVMSIVILVPSMTGFVMKFIEFIHTFQGESDGAFAITPMLNYLLASLGFFCLLLWATLNGMFHDLERPKYHMLEVEEQLDRQLKTPG
jgi:hypothetical protein